MPASVVRRVAMPDEGVETLFGSLDENLRSLEATLGVKLRTSGHDVVVEGSPEDAAAAERMLEQLGGLLRSGYRFARGDVKTAAQLIADDPQVELQNYFAKAATKTVGRRQVAPKSVNQRRYLEAIEKDDIVFGVGPAGTGKTYLAMAQAVSYLLAKRVTRIILARPAVEAGEKLGFLPGDLQEKVNPYLRPLYDALHDMMDVDKAAGLVNRGAIEVAPLAFMRGRTLNDSFVILDEAQNTTSDQMRMFLTRLGYSSRGVVTGDVTQVDLPSGARSGLAEARDLLTGVEGIAMCTFTEVDVVRHPLVQKIIIAYDKLDAEKKAAAEARAALPKS